METVAAEIAAESPGSSPVPAPARSRPRRVIAAVLIVLTALLSIVTLLSGYVRGDLLTTERYVQIVGPLARNPHVQAEVIDATTAAVVDNIRVSDLTADALTVIRAGDGRLAQLLTSDRRLAQALNGVLSGLGPLLQNQLEAVTRRAAERIVRSDRFADLWVEANRRAHATALAALRGDGSALRTDGGEVRIDISVIVEAVQQRLVDSGFTLAERIPVVDRQIVLVRSAELAKAQGGLRIFDQTAPWVPWVTLAFAVAAVLVAPGRRRALVWLGVALAVAAGATAVALAAGRAQFLAQVANTSVDPAAAAAIADAALAPLWSRVLFVIVAATLIAVVALLSGPVGGRIRTRLTRERPPASATE